MSERSEFEASAGSQDLSGLAFWADKALTVIAGLILFGTMLMTGIDVFGRYLFNSPLGFAYEMTELAMASTFFIALSVVTLRGEHINVGLFDAFFVGRMAAFRDTVISAFMVLGTGFICWRMLLFAGKLAGYGDTTNVLKVYLYPFAYLGAVGLGLAAAAGAYRLAMAVRRLVLGTA